MVARLSRALFPLVLMASSLAFSQGERPPELLWGNVTERHAPTIRLDDATTWTVSASPDAQASFSASTAQNLWNRPVGRLQYRGSGDPFSVPVVTVRPPRPVAIPDGSDRAQLWLYGNRWAYLYPQDYPSVKVRLLIADAGGQVTSVPMDEVAWEGWYAVSKRLPDNLRRGATFQGLEVVGGWQSDFRDLYFDSIRFSTDGSGPLNIGARPKRNLTLVEGQLPGANIGGINLEFPTREETILPPQLSGRYSTSVDVQGGALLFRYDGADATILYAFEAAKGIAGVHAWTKVKKPAASTDVATVEKAPGKGLAPALPAASAKAKRATGPTVVESLGGGMSYLGRLSSGAHVKLYDGTMQGALTEAWVEGDTGVARYADGTELRIKLAQKSLVVDVINRTGNAAEMDLGVIASADNPKTIPIPFLSYRGERPAVAMTRGDTEPVFASVWLDWYRSNATEMYGESWAKDSVARVNGGVRYHLLSNVTLNPMIERVFFTVSPRFEETLPSIPNPTALYASQAADRVVHVVDVPGGFADALSNAARYRNYGIEKVLALNGPSIWQDGDESTAFRLVGAPGKGGEKGLAEYLNAQGAMGWTPSMFLNFTHASPTSAVWNEDDLILTGAGDWRVLDQRLYGIKGLKALEYQAAHVAQLKSRYAPKAAFIQTLTAEKPWWLTDMDGRVYGSGSFVQTFYNYGDFLRNESRSLGAPVFSEGTFQWMYAGLGDGNLAREAESGSDLERPLNPVFALTQIHPRELGLGMGTFEQFVGKASDLTDEREVDRLVDRFLANIVAYGNSGMLVDKKYGVHLTMRSYYMIQALQQRYALRAPTKIAFWDGFQMRSASEAMAMGLPTNSRMVYVEYPNGLKVWANDNPSMGMTATLGEAMFNIPPGGFMAYRKGDVFAISGAVVSNFENMGGLGSLGGGRTDYVRSSAYTYLDGRGRLFETPEGSCDGALAIRPVVGNRLELVHGSGGLPITVNRPYGTKGKVTSIEAFAEIGNSLGTLGADFDDGKRTSFRPMPGAVRYLLTFGG
ncbi:MAG: hypothetical protein KIS66_15155 [Fimbriimonadaceae bacterium]|nr:hypothetical protein [Fimbriimonadaceae bacterium]